MLEHQRIQANTWFISSDPRQSTVIPQHRSFPDIQLAWPEDLYYPIEKGRNGIPRFARQAINTESHER